MNSYNFKFKGKNYHRVTRRTFLKWFSENKEGCFCLCPFKMSPVGIWQVGHFSEIKRLREEDYNIQSHINSFEYYNCTNETGNYASFYIAE